MAKRPKPSTEARTAKVRMYRDILGDCFLIQLSEGDRTVHVLIDCGILQGMPDATDRARRIMRDVAETTGGVLDVLIVTHEHWDHLSGFAQAGDVFDGMRVKELWLAWTEDERDELARKLRERRRQALAVVQRSNQVALRLAAGNSQESDEDVEEIEDDRASPSLGISGILAFFGLAPGLPAGPRTDTILENLKKQAEVVRFFRPGSEAIPVAGLTHFRAFILGPPRDETLLKRSRPRTSKPEVYELAASGADDMFFMAALSADMGGGSDAGRPNLPFGDRWLLKPPAASTSTSGETSDTTFYRTVYDNQAEEWRRIDEDWLLAGEQLALKLDSDTNNTSLAIAFEIGDGPDARVLLFPGDAQVGNWLSWGDLRFERSGMEDVTIEDLFARTVLYKVGHHGSHNATLRERGLELMTSRELVAMVPVDERFANDVKHWNMPFPSLLRRLDEKTVRRTIRADRGKEHLTALAGEFGGREGELSPGQWKLFLDQLRDISDTDGPLAIEYSLPV